MSDETTQRLRYLTTGDVREQYGFDPSPFVERVQAGDNFIRSKLVPVVGELVRLWLEDDVRRHPSARRKP